MPQLADVPTRSALDRLARAATEVFAPAVWAAAMPSVIALRATRPDWGAGLGWALLTVVFCAVVPYGVIWLGVRRGRLTDHHLGVREQRRTPLLHGLASVLTGLVVLLVLGAPRPLVAMVVVMSAVLVIIAVVNQFWKLSAHAAVATGAASVLIFEFGPPLLVALLVVTAVGWSRVRLGDHTSAQVVAGGAAGVVVGLPLFVLIA